MIGIIGAIMMFAAAPAQDGAAGAGRTAGESAAEPVSSSVRGITGFAEFTASGPRLRAHSGQTREWPLVARVVGAEPWPGGSGPGDERTRYRVAYIGMIAGDFDLRDCLERQDGSALNLPALPVRILSQLEADPGTDLFSSLEAPAIEATRYRSLMIGIAVAWAAVPVVYIIVRVVRRRPAPPPPPVVTPPTLADQLRPLVDAAKRGTLSVADRGRLELLLYLYWRTRLALGGPQPEVISMLRTHAEAGVLLQTIERWLHAPRGSSDAVEGEVSALLEPYRNAPAIHGPVEPSP